MLFKSFEIHKQHLVLRNVKAIERKQQRETKVLNKNFSHGDFYFSVNTLPTQCDLPATHYGYRQPFNYMKNTGKRCHE